MSLANSQMVSGRFLKLAKGRKLIRRMNACWDAQGVVTIGTAMSVMNLKAAHRKMVWIGKSGSVYLRRGKKSDCLDFCGFGFTA